jgi:hypothetical protein
MVAQGRDQPGTHLTRVAKPPSIDQLNIDRHSLCCDDATNPFKELLRLEAFIGVSKVHDLFICEKERTPLFRLYVSLRLGEMPDPFPSPHHKHFFVRLHNRTDGFHVFLPNGPGVNRSLSWLRPRLVCRLQCPTVHAKFVS